MADDGLCECGCGQSAPLAPYTDRTRGYVKGKPLRFIAQHHRRLKIGWTVRPGPLATPCWIWNGAPDAEGYGRVYIAGKVVKAHHWSWAKHRGESVPKPLDHLCRVRNCVNPDHLEPVTHRENVLRGEGPTAENARKTMCSHGHALSGGNLIVRASGGRDCRECMRRRGREYQRRRRAK